MYNSQIGKGPGVGAFVGTAMRKHSRVLQARGQNWQCTVYVLRLQRHAFWSCGISRGVSCHVNKMIHNGIT